MGVKDVLPLLRQPCGPCQGGASGGRAGRPPRPATSTAAPWPFVRTSNHTLHKQRRRLCTAIAAGANKWATRINGVHVNHDIDWCHSIPHEMVTQTMNPNSDQRSLLSKAHDGFRCLRS
ncbi:hypothetical protein B296_00000966 [Ensete ventricosum]|uniref:Uncharacterized protein n=1 Tax=Ensete ventricosum TaxID=4639 RepID=A0A427B0X1_ENSVE|nr:hypothetical protein B296_00000966 [Ensete ventricosum]